MDEVLMVVVPGVVMSVLTWFLARRKNKAEATTNELDNVEKAIKIWRELSSDLNVRLTKEIDELRTENCKLKKELRAMLKEYETMQAQIDALEEQLKAARCENKKLINEIKKYNNNFTLANEGT